MDIRKNEKYIITAESIDQQGRGVGRINGVVVFVNGLLPKETAEVLIIKVASNYAVGKLLALKEKSPHRVDTPCRYFGACGGCSMQHLAYAEQLRYKTSQVREALKRIGGVEDIEVEECLGMSDPFRYRNKAQFPVAAAGIGLYASGTHRLIDIDDCLIQHPLNAQIMSTVRSYNIEAYDELTRKGLLRHIVTKFSPVNGKFMVILVLNSRSDKLPKGFADSLRAIDGVASVYVNFNTSSGNVILGDAVLHIAGDTYLEDVTCGIAHKVMPMSFRQVNPLQTEVLYSKAVELAVLSGNETVFDAYCGAGVLSLLLAKQSKKVYGVEIVPQAIEAAKDNARDNGISNAEFICGECEKVYPKLLSKGIKPDVIVVDPPRKGCDSGVLCAFAEASPEKIVYISCNPATLARDIKLMTEKGYRLKTVQPVDMFPQTGHVESVVLLSREKADDYVRISVHTKDLQAKAN